MVKKQKNANPFSKGFGRTVAQKAGYMAYGAIRPTLSNGINKLPFVQKFAGFEILDEVALIGASYVGRKVLGRNKMPFVSDFLKGADAIEWARIGDWSREQVKSMMNGNGTVSSFNM